MSIIQSVVLTSLGWIQNRQSRCRYCILLHCLREGAPLQYLPPLHLALVLDHNLIQLNRFVFLRDTSRKLQLLAQQESKQIQHLQNKIMGLSRMLTLLPLKLLVQH